MANAFCQDSLEGGLGLHSSVIPNTDQWILAYLTGDNDILSHIKTYDIGIMFKDEILFVLLVIQTDPNSSCVIDNLASGAIFHIISRIMASISINIL